MDVTRGSAAKKKAHVIVVTSTTRTHNDIFVQILHYLAQKHPGLTVTVIGNKEQLSRMENLTGLDLHLKDGYGTSVYGTSMSQDFALDTESVRKELITNEDLLGKPTCIVSSKFQSWSQVWASELGIPWYPIFPSPVFALVVIETPKVQEASLGPEKPVVYTHAPGVVPAPILSLVRPEDIPSPVFNNPGRSYLSAERLKRATALVLNASEGLDPEGRTTQALRTVVQSSRILTIGPILQHRGFGFNHWDSTYATCKGLDWLDSQRDKSVLYMAFGTTAFVSSSTISSIAAGVEASGVPFLWVLALENKQLSEVLPPGFLDRTSLRGRIETSFVPQCKILSHPSIGGFFCHGGWNSLMEAVSAGVPVLAWPGGTDQYQNVRYMVELANAGYSISDFKGENKRDFEDIGSREVEMAVRHLMLGGEDDVKRNLKAMREIVQADVAEGGSSYLNLHSFLDEIANP